MTCAVEHKTGKINEGLSLVSELVAHYDLDINDKTQRQIIKILSDATRRYIREAATKHKFYQVEVKKLAELAFDTIRGFSDDSLEHLNTEMIELLETLNLVRGSSKQDRHTLFQAVLAKAMWLNHERRHRDYSEDVDVALEINTITNTVLNQQMTTQIPKGWSFPPETQYTLNDHVRKFLGCEEVADDCIYCLKYKLPHRGAPSKLFPEPSVNPFASPVSRTIVLIDSIAGNPHPTGIEFPDESESKHKRHKTVRWHNDVDLSITNGKLQPKWGKKNTGKTIFSRKRAKWFNKRIQKERQHTPIWKPTSSDVLNTITRFFNLHRKDDSTANSKKNSVVTQIQGACITNVQNQNDCIRVPIASH